MDGSPTGQTCASVRLGLLQHASGDDRETNLARATALGEQAADAGAQVLVTQELLAGPYFPRVEDEACFDLAESIPGPTTDALAALASKRGVDVLASVFERRSPGVCCNTLVHLKPDGTVGQRYRKMHIPHDPQFYEKYYFTPGDAEQFPVVVEVGCGARIGLLVCWDQWYPEAARLTAMAGAQVIVYPTAIAWLAGEPAEEQERQREAWITMQRSHAIANGVYVAAINRIGGEGDLTFWGSSFAAAPGGRIMVQAASDRDEVVLVDCDLAKIEASRRAWPFFRDRRIDAYGSLTKRWLD